MCIVVEGPELTLVDFDNILDISKEKKSSYLLLISKNIINYNYIGNSRLSFIQRRDPEISP